MINDMDRFYQDRNDPAIKIIRKTIKIVRLYSILRQKMNTILKIGCKY